MKEEWIRLIMILIFCSFSSMLIWLNMNLRYVSDWWMNNYILNFVLLGPFVSASAYYSWGYLVDNLDSLWSARLISFAIGTVTFLLLTWLILGETPFTLKNILCIILATVIVLIQLFF